jgi:hypothetical protein
LLIAGIALAAGGSAVAKDMPTGRQYYGQWHASPNPGCYFRYYYSKPSVSSPEYKKQRVYYYTSAPAYLYFYNPDAGNGTGKFWCRCPTVKNSDPTCKQKAMDQEEWWSVLDEGDREHQLEDCIGDFPDPDDDNCPEIPGSMDHKLMKMPPPDLPI